jgi:hypothetical protein
MTRLTFRRAWSWARWQIVDELSRSLAVDERRTFDDRAEIVARVGGRVCRVTLWTKQADIEVAFARTVIPEGLEINEASVWGPQKNEAWSSGQAALTGDTEFDADFMVLSTDSDKTRLPEMARSIPASVRAALIDERRRGGLRDAEIRPAEVALSVRASGRHRKTPAKGRIAWTFGSIFLGFNEIPTAQDVQDCIAQANRIAEALEAAS